MAEPTAAPDEVHLQVSTALHDLWGYREVVDADGRNVDFDAAVARFTAQRWVRLAIDTAYRAGRESARAEVDVELRLTRPIVAAAEKVVADWRADPPLPVGAR